MDKPMIKFEQPPVGAVCMNDMTGFTSKALAVAYVHRLPRTRETFYVVQEVGRWFVHVD